MLLSFSCVQFLTNYDVSKKKATYRPNHFVCTKIIFLSGNQVTQDYFKCFCIQMFRFWLPTLYLNSYQVNKLRQFSGNESFIFRVASREVCHLAHDRVDACSSDDCPGRSSNHEGRVEGHVPGAQLIFVGSVYIQLEWFGFTWNNWRGRNFSNFKVTKASVYNVRLM